jgi:two-component system sensor histidine kinase DegS
MILRNEHRKDARFMTEKRMNNDGIIDNSIEDGKTSVVLLKNLAVDYEEQLYSVKIQINSNSNLLKKKEVELAERERTKVHNRDLFSPIYNQTNNTLEINSTILQLKEQIQQLNDEQNRLESIINGLNNAAQCINELKEVHNNQNHNSKQKFIDKGLSILEAQEAERQRIARDLHDTTVQNLTSLVHKSELCAKLIDIDTIRAKLELNTMSNTLKSIINDMRGIIYNLKPMTLDDLGLTITIQRYANRIMDFNNIQVKVQANEETKEILPVIKLTLFRIIQEACNNVLKHANATLINIDIIYEDHWIKVFIKDNGSGFQMEHKLMPSTEQSSSFGLSIMRERASLLSGICDIQSEKGKGTIVTISVPLTIHEEEKDEQTN